VWKRKGRHPSEALTGDFIRSVEAVGLYPDGNCLYLRVDEAGCKRWILRTMIQGKRQDMGLGSLTRISLLEARARARKLRGIARQGGDPFAEREQVFSALQLEITQAVDEILNHLRNAGAVVDEAMLAKLGR